MYAYQEQITYLKRDHIYNANLKSQDKTTILKLKNIFSNILNEAIYIFNIKDNKYDYISPLITSLTGYTVQEILQKGIEPFIIKSRFIDENNELNIKFGTVDKLNITRHNKKWHADYLIRKANNEEIWLLDIAYPWYNDQGQLAGYIGCLQDNNDKMQAEANYIDNILNINSDPLTGCINKYKFFDYLDIELNRLHRNKSTVSTLLLDIDSLADINNKHGETTGDLILKQVAQLIKSCLRSTDLFARMSGQEFGIILPDTKLEGAYWVAERIRSSINNYKFEGYNQTSIRCTLSIGIASTSTNDKLSLSKLIKLAETRLYIAKTTGKNCISIDEVFT